MEEKEIMENSPLIELEDLVHAGRALNLKKGLQFRKYIISPQ